MKNRWAAKKSLDQIKKDLYERNVGETKHKLEIGLGNFFQNLRNMINDSDDEEQNNNDNKSCYEQSLKKIKDQQRDVKISVR